MAKKQPEGEPRDAAAPKPGGIPKPEHEVTRLTDIAEDAMLYGCGRARLRQILARAVMPPLPRGTPDNRPVDLDLMPERTADDYARRVRERWKEEELPGRQEARKQARRRYLRTLTALRGSPGGIAKVAQAMAQFERLLKDIEGTDAPKVVHLAGEGGGPIEVKTSTVPTSDERRRRAAELADKARARVAAAAQATTPRDAS